VCDGIAYFRTAAPDVLTAALTSASTPIETNPLNHQMPTAAVATPGTTFYVLTVINL
jgi:hypothetical protein